MKIQPINFKKHGQALFIATIAGLGGYFAVQNIGDYFESRKSKKAVKR